MRIRYHRYYMIFRLKDVQFLSRSTNMYVIKIPTYRYIHHWGTYWFSLDVSICLILHVGIWFLFKPISYWDHLVFIKHLNFHLTTLSRCSLLNLRFRKPSGKYNNVVKHGWEHLDGLTTAWFNTCPTKSNLVSLSLVYHVLVCLLCGQLPTKELLPMYGLS